MKHQQKAKPEYELIATNDGSTSLRDSITGETFHSSFGAITESRVVFIQNGLNFFIQNYSPQKIHLLEIGFGTGLNALLTLARLSESNINIAYTAIDAFPLSEEDSNKLNFTKMPELACFNNDFMAFHKHATQHLLLNNGQFLLRKQKIYLLEFEPEPQSFDIVYFDAFSPNVQPELWSKEVFLKLFNALKNPGILVTYSARGSVKEALRACGFIVERLSGPPGKRHVIRATKKT
jgi:tRNA U34 5-methylaminomethyl-2-thiouridine-forming methyltransferase MnmC